MGFSLNPKEMLRRFTEIDDTPHAIALGSAIGMFWGFTPLYGLKTLLSLGAARLFRGHMVAAAITVTLQDVFLPVMPALILLQLRIGNALLGKSAQEEPVSLHHFHAADLLQWTTYVHEAFPFLLGSAVVGAAAGLATYGGVYRWAGGRRRKEAGK